MSTEKNQEVANDTTNNEGEGKEVESETITIPKKDYDVLNQTLGSYKREIKDLKKSPSQETPKNQPEDALLQRIEGLALAHAGVEHDDDVELAKNTAKKWGIPLEKVLRDEDFKVKLERQQTARTNAIATSNIKGGAGTSQAKNTPEYWIAKGTPPNPTDVPDRKTRAKIVKSMMANAKTGGKKYYNE